MRRFTLAVLAGAGVACAPAPAPTSAPAPAAVPGPSVTPVMLPPGVAWAAAPATLPPGARAAVIDGDPTKEGLFTLRLWMPNDYRILPHTHPAYEHITVIRGVLHVGMGNTFTMANVDELRQGAFKAISPGMAHFAHAAGETVVQLHGMGPWRITYVNPADDPRNR